jgi:hypothetical protein
MEDLRGRQIDRQFYAEEVSLVLIKKLTTYKIFKMRVLLREYSADLGSWNPAFAVKTI